MSWTKLFIIHFIVFLFLILVAEIGLRIIWTINSCHQENCDFSRLKNLSIYDWGLADSDLGISKYDKILGYIPNPYFKGIVNVKNWNSSYLSIDKDGFRENYSYKEDSIFKDNKTNLLIGDSFAFGDQVSNHETVPACLEKIFQQKTLNGGVFGYGAAQAVKRASVITKKYKIEKLIFSIFLRDDFYRDQYTYRSGFPKPSVINLDGVIKYAQVPKKKSVLGSKFNPKKINFINKFFYHNSMIGMRIINLFSSNLSGTNYTSINPLAASLDEIIEFTLLEFQKIKAKKKILLFQYSENDLDKNDLKYSFSCLE